MTAATGGLMMPAGSPAATAALFTESPRSSAARVSVPPIAIWPQWRGRNVGDRLLVRGARALLESVTDARIAETPIGDPVPSDSLVVMPGGMALASSARFRDVIEPLLRSRRGVVLPSTFGPLTDEDAAVFAQLEHPIAAREATSAAIASQLLGRDVPVLADPAFFALTGEPEPGTRTVFSPRREDLWYMHRAVTTKTKHTEAWARYLPLLEKTSDPILVAHANVDQKLCRKLSEATGVPWVRRDEALEAYRTCRSVVTSRYHGAVIGLGYGKPVEVIAFERHGHKMTVDLGMDVPQAMADTRAWLREALA